MNTTTNIKQAIDAFVADLREDMRHNRVILPTLPDISVQALFMVNSETTSIDELTALVVRDAAMASRLIRYANSPAFRGQVRCNTIKSSITRLGLDKTKHLLLALAMKHVFNSGHEGMCERMERLWEHSVEVAMLSMLLAHRYAHLDMETALLAGLVHDIGIIPILDRVKDDERIVVCDDAINAIISALHVPLGKAILTAWNFPSQLVAAAAQHLDFERDISMEAPIDYVDIVQAANLESYSSMPNNHLAHLDRIKLPCMRRLGCTLEDPQLHWDEDSKLMQEVSAIFM